MYGSLLFCIEDSALFEIPLFAIRFFLFGDFRSLFFGNSWRGFEGVFFAVLVWDSHMST